METQKQILQTEEKNELNQEFFAQGTFLPQRSRLLYVPHVLQQEIITTQTQQTVFNAQDHQQEVTRNKNLEIVMNEEEQLDETLEKLNFKYQPAQMILQAECKQLIITQVHQFLLSKYKKWAK